jgi:hypothetical protein
VRANFTQNHQRITPQALQRCLDGDLTDHGSDE